LIPRGRITRAARDAHCEAHGGVGRPCRPALRESEAIDHAERAVLSGLWGKLGGAGIGLAIGGPLGALIGALAGHVLVDREGALLAPPDRELVFTTGIVALSAKMARSDGVVTRDEVAMFRQIVEVPEAEMPRVQALFDLAKATSAGFEAYAAQLAKLFHDAPGLLEDVLDGLFHVAAADGVLHQAEHDYLLEVAHLFGFDDARFAQIEARHVRRVDDPYVILGVSRAEPTEAIRRAWKALVAEHHPDRAIARGLPPEAIAIATDRMAALNAAWQRIDAERAARLTLAGRPAKAS
jgi:DnaJ like chaperone protein